MWDVLVVGSGAAGMMAALTAAGKGARCLVLEKGGHIAVSNAAAQALSSTKCDLR